MNLPSKPSFGQPCNGCGYCCTAEPCALAVEFLQCSQGPCVALEQRDGKASCGLVRNPLGYLYKAAQPHDTSIDLEHAPESSAAQELSTQIATALGIGRGCDSEDDSHSAMWPMSLSTPAS